VTVNSVTDQGRIWGAVAGSRQSTHASWSSPIYREILARLELPRGARFLDAGCGSGDNTGIAVDLGLKPFGLDPSAPMVEAARARLPGATIEIASMEKTPFADGFFDGVAAVNSLHFTSNPLKALRELHRIMVPGGRLAVNSVGPREEFHLEAVVRRLLELVPRERRHEDIFIDPFRIAAAGIVELLMRECGFEVQSVVYVDCPMRFDTFEQASGGMSNIGLFRAVAECVGAAAAMNAVRPILEANRAADGTVVLGAMARVVVAAKPHS
jgi:SAM-dependent methyltransferase